MTDGRTVDKKTQHVLGFLYIYNIIMIVQVFHWTGQFTSTASSNHPKYLYLTQTMMMMMMVSLLLLFRASGVFQ